MQIVQIDIIQHMGKSHLGICSSLNILWYPIIVFGKQRPDQTAQMFRLIWAFALCIWSKTFSHGVAHILSRYVRKHVFWHGSKTFPHGVAHILSRYVRKHVFWHGFPTTTNQPVHPRSLIRVFVISMKKLCILGYPYCTLWRFWSDCKNVLTDLNLCWAHMPKGTFYDVALFLYQ